MGCNGGREIAEKKLNEYKAHREEAMRQYQAAHGAVQAMEQLLREINNESREEENGK